MIQIQMDLNGNGNCADIEPRENIRYELGATNFEPVQEQPSSDAMATAWSRMRQRQTQANCLGTTMRMVCNLANTPPLAAIKRIGISFSVGMKQTDSKNGWKSHLHAF